MERQWHLNVFGVVQGVNLRFETQNKARSLKLTGWVRNLDAGNIEIMAVGQETDLNKLLNWLKSSPGYSKVTEINKDNVDQIEIFDGFEIMY